MSLVLTGSEVMQVLDMDLALAAAADAFRAYGAGRVFHSPLGHDVAAFQNPEFYKAQAMRMSSASKPPTEGAAAIEPAGAAF